ncbi:glycine betaine ABC transporter substrate-binding protein [Microbacterium sp. zg.Y1090]|uniref:glycine betaine ABC transporter substrate-binding protein n=1 Tax=Microbacterium TaxID=33882 RepID=UPI00214B2DFF|nr:MULTISPECIES: glycine betaine ABC transporter substrate-binding protein [unclassified Microbacterium]MCR2813081.1 glycine betaine ABC transporter substrate-binding protein [Microbacterium sp. zg.Y1084]MCR2819395.1 glycine betaine ABC transporter substrate-binding protein [Microbacterium sp. zg.Y1090]MDL5487061.1 glycine betaine ABC transporter substrate-binding protein [Microbacterium sp. zg-Y1211]WIM28374.1 glycine betaine ABC transporter substrate-binding protein [Microbacterium sp. zg-Y10
MTKRNTILGALALTSAAALTLTGCAGGSDSTGSEGDAAADRPITIAVFNGWDEGIAASELWKAVLEEQGYEVELEYADPAAVYNGIASGDYDVTLDTWLPLTHADYIEEYGDDMVDLGAWNTEAKLTFAVNEDAPIDSIEELADNADLFGSTIYGIESGSGLATVTDSAVIPGYGLEGFDHVTSSTPAMLTELDTATRAGENILVTLWRPHWAYDAFPIKDLEDPKGLLGDAEGIHSFASTSFEQDFPEVFAWLSAFEMDSETLYSLENVMFNENDSDDYESIVADWMAANEEYVSSLTTE